MEEEDLETDFLKLLLYYFTPLGLTAGYYGLIFILAEINWVADENNIFRCCFTEA